MEPTEPILAKSLIFLQFLHVCIMNHDVIKIMLQYTLQNLITLHVLSGTVIEWVQHLHHHILTMHGGIAHCTRPEGFLGLERPKNP